jgi:glycerol-3-phosphate O-acyltransferase
MSAKSSLYIVHKKGKLFFLYYYFFVVHILFLSIIMASIIDTFVTKSDKLVGQSNYNVWKLKVINLLLKEDLLDFVEIDTIVTLGQKKQHTKINNKVLTIINISTTFLLFIKSSRSKFFKVYQILSQCHIFLFFLPSPF